MRSASAFFVLVAAGLLAAGGALSAQHATAFDIEDGGRAFRNTCANCHGPDGDQVAGIALGRGQYRRAPTDQEHVGIIRNGIPNTPMPANHVSEAQAVKIVAYLRSLAE
jgi:mono/diheme cytochrome c family protein